MSLILLSILEYTGSEIIPPNFMRQAPSPNVMWETKCPSLEIVEIGSVLFVRDLIKSEGRIIF